MDSNSQITCEPTQNDVFYLLASDKLRSGSILKDYNEEEFHDYLIYLYTHFLDNWKHFSQQDDDDLLFSFNYFNSTTNNVKNITKAFIKYMTTAISDGLVLECIDTLSKSSFDIIKQFKRFCDRHQVNNNYLQRIVKNERYGKQFNYYLQFYSIEWLHKSRVKDKIIHLLVIFFLSRCFTNPLLLDHVVFYKKLHLTKISKQQVEGINNQQQK